MVLVAFPRRHSRLCPCTGPTTVRSHIGSSEPPLAVLRTENDGGRCHTTTRAREQTSKQGSVQVNAGLTGTADIGTKSVPTCPATQASAPMTSSATAFKGLLSSPILSSAPTSLRASQIGLCHPEKYRLSLPAVRDTSSSHRRLLVTPADCHCVFPL